MSSSQHVAGSALWVVSVLGLVLVALNLLGVVVDLGPLDPPGPGLVYVAVALAASAASSALLKEDRS